MILAEVERMLTLRLDPELDARLGHAAIDQRATKSRLIREAVTAMLESHQAATEKPIMSDLTRALRKCEDAITDALVDEAMDNQPNPRLAGMHDIAKRAIIILRELAGVAENYENLECIGANMGRYASGVGPWND